MIGVNHPSSPPYPLGSELPPVDCQRLSCRANFYMLTIARLLDVNVFDGTRTWRESSFAVISSTHLTYCLPFLLAVANFAQSRPNVCIFPHNSLRIVQAFHYGFKDAVDDTFIRGHPHHYPPGELTAHSSLAPRLTRAQRSRHQRPIRANRDSSPEQRRYPSRLRTRIASPRPPLDHQRILVVAAKRDGGRCAVRCGYCVGTDAAGEAREYAETNVGDDATTGDCVAAGGEGYWEIEETENPLAYVVVLSLDLLNS